MKSIFSIALFGLNLLVTVLALPAGPKEARIIPTEDGNTHHHFGPQLPGTMPTNLQRRNHGLLKPTSDVEARHHELLKSADLENWNHELLKSSEDLQARNHNFLKSTSDVEARHHESLKSTDLESRNHESLKSVDLESRHHELLKESEGFQVRHHESLKSSDLKSRHHELLKSSEDIQARHHNFLKSTDLENRNHELKSSEGLEARTHNTLKPINLSPRTHTPLKTTTTTTLTPRQDSTLLCKKQKPGQCTITGHYKNGIASILLFAFDCSSRGEIHGIQNDVWGSYMMYPNRPIKYKWSLYGDWWLFWEFYQSKGVVYGSGCLHFNDNSVVCRVQFNCLSLQDKPAGEAEIAESGGEVNRALLG